MSGDAQDETGVKDAARVLQLAHVSITIVDALGLKKGAGLNQTEGGAMYSCQGALVRNAISLSHQAAPALRWTMMDRLPAAQGAWMAVVGLCWHRL